MGGDRDHESGTPSTLAELGRTNYGIKHSELLSDAFERTANRTSVD